MVVHDPTKTALRQIHRLLCEVIAPRPLVLVTTVDAEDRRNAAPFSSIIPITGKPPLLVLSFNRRRNGTMKRTMANILTQREFVVNIVEEPELDEALQLSQRSSQPASEKWPAGLGAAPSEQVCVPRIAACRTAIECKLQSHQILGEDGFLSDLVIGKIVIIWRVPEVELRPLGCLDLDRCTDGERRLHRPFPSSTNKKS